MLSQAGDDCSFGYYGAFVIVGQSLAIPGSGQLTSPCSIECYQTGPGSQHWSTMLEQLTVLLGPYGLAMRVAVSLCSALDFYGCGGMGRLLASLASPQI